MLNRRLRFRKRVYGDFYIDDSPSRDVQTYIISVFEYKRNRIKSFKDFIEATENAMQDGSYFWIEYYCEVLEGFVHGYGKHSWNDDEWEDFNYQLENQYGESWINRTEGKAFDWMEDYIKMCRHLKD